MPSLVFLLAVFLTLQFHLVSLVFAQRMLFCSYTIHIFQFTFSNVSLNCGFSFLCSYVIFFLLISIELNVLAASHKHFIAHWVCSFSFLSLLCAISFKPVPDAESSEWQRATKVFACVPLHTQPAHLVLFVACWMAFFATLPGSRFKNTLQTCSRNMVFCVSQMHCNVEKEVFTVYTSWELGEKRIQEKRQKSSFEKEKLDWKLN